MCNANGLNSPTDPRAIIETRARRAIYDLADPREKKMGVREGGAQRGLGAASLPPLRSPQGTQPPSCAFSLAHPGGGVKGFGKIFLDFFFGPLVCLFCAHFGGGLAGCLSGLFPCRFIFFGWLFVCLLCSHL